MRETPPYYVGGRAPDGAPAYDLDDDRSLDDFNDLI